MRAGKIYPLYGPVELSHQQIAEAVTKTLGYPVNYVPVEIEEFQAYLERIGCSAHLSQHLSDVALDYRNGIFAGTSDAIRSIAGTDALTVEAFVERNQAHFDDHSSRHH